MNGSPSLVYRRLPAPSENGGVFIQPVLAEAERARASNADALNVCAIEIAGRTLAEWRGTLSLSLIRTAAEYTRQYRDVTVNLGEGKRTPLWMAGHQPQLFHPGVWIKNFVLGRLAAENAGVALNLVVDNDLARSPSILVPTGSPAEPVVEEIAFDAPASEQPFEERGWHDREAAEGFGERVAKQIRGLVADPWIREFWPTVLERRSATGNLGAALSQARHRWEGAWGLNTLELPISRMCELPGWAAFVAHLLERADAFRGIHNVALAEYRQLHRLRSAAHPVPDLVREEDWVETPFWVWQKQSPRRRLFVRASGGKIVLTDRAGWEERLRSADLSGAIEQFTAVGIKIRPRALTTTLFVRLFLADIFLHGIGGAKYDQITDLIMGRFFVIAPPAYMIVTGTLRLPIDGPRLPESDSQWGEGGLREFEFHPERFQSETGSAERGSAAAAIAEKRTWVFGPPAEATAKERCHAIREANARIRAALNSVKPRLVAARYELRRSAAREKVLDSREYAFCLHPQLSLRTFLGQ